MHINVNSSELENPKKRQQLQTIIKEATLTDYNHPLLEEHASARLEDFAENQREGNQTLKFFENKIPRGDVPILRAALYIRSVHRRGQPVDALKRDIVERFGTRGSNIANLCSAGYFESQLKPMYRALAARPNFEPQIFIDSYNVIVNSAPFAVFVGRVRSLDDLMLEIEEKLEANRSYGIKQMNIHAIGPENVQNSKSSYKTNGLRSTL